MKRKLKTKIKTEKDENRNWLKSIHKRLVGSSNEMFGTRRQWIDINKWNLKVQNDGRRRGPKMKDHLERKKEKNF